MASCAPTDPNIDAAKSAIKGQNYQAALQAAEKAIDQTPNKGQGYYYKGVALSELAKDKAEQDSLQLAQKYYREMRENFDKAKDLFQQAEDTPGEAKNLDAVILSLWSREHNKGVELATNDSLSRQEALPKAAFHLENATIIQPDSALSWDVLTEIYVMENKIGKATKTLETAIAKSDSVSPDKYRRLSQFYNQQKEYENALKVLKKAQNEYPDNLDVVQNLADTYLQMGETNKAIDVVEQLIEQDPQNPQYHLVLGTQLYQTVTKASDSLQANYDQLFELERQKRKAGDQEAQQIEQKISNIEQQNDQLEGKINKVTDRALEELNKVVDLRPDDAKAYNIMGIIYQNRAAALYEKRNRTEDNEQAKKFNQQAVDQLQQARKNYEKATDLEPDNKDYWRNLFKVYTTLGMKEKAQEAMEKAGLNN